MNEIPKAPVLMREEFDKSLDCYSYSRLLDNINNWIAAEWANLFEGAYICETTSVGCDLSPGERGCATQIRLKPVPIRKPGVTRAEIEEMQCEYLSTEAGVLFKRILDEGLAE